MENGEKYFFECQLVIFIFQENNIKPFEVIDGTSTAIEYGESRIIDKPLLPGASIDDRKRY